MQEFDVDNIVAYACWAPSYEVNETISILNYEIKIKKIIEDKIYGFKYEIELIGVKYKIKNMIVNEEELIDEDMGLIKQIKKKLMEKKFEVDFTNKILGLIYKI